MVTRVKGSVWNSKDNSLPANVVDYGADPTGVADSATAIQNAINENSSVYIPTGTYRVDTMITIGDFKSVELGGNCTLMREDTGNGDPVIWMNGQYSSVRGQGQTTSSIGSKARASEGVVRIGQPNMHTVGTKDISYNTISDLNISGASFQNPAGPYGQTTGALDICLHMQAPELVRLSDGFTWAVYFNNIMNLRLTDANIGLYLHGFSNGNLISNIHGFRLGNTTLGGAMILDEGSVDNNLTSLFHHKSDDTTTIEMKQLDNRNLTGTYSQAGTTTITVTIPSHKLLAGESINLNFTSGTGVDGIYTIDTVPDVNTFTVTAAGVDTTTGDVTVPGTNTSIPAGYQGNVHKCLYNSYRGVGAEQGGTAVGLRANDGSVTACFVEIRDNVAGGNDLDATFTDRNWFFSGTTGATSSTNRYADFVNERAATNRNSRIMRDQIDAEFFKEQYHSIRSMAENTTYRAVEITFTANQQSATVEIDFAAGSGSSVEANGGGKVLYTMVKNASGVVSADARLARYVPSTISPCAPQISGDTVTIPFLTYNNGTATTVQRLHMMTKVNTSNNITAVVPTFYDTATTAASTGTPVSNTL